MIILQNKAKYVSMIKKIATKDETKNSNKLERKFKRSNERFKNNKNYLER